MTDTERRRLRFRVFPWIGAWLGDGGGVTSRGGKRKDNFASVLATYHVVGKPLYIVGTFGTGVTVFNQQILALNLVGATR
jgi:hypothetical protein